MNEKEERELNQLSIQNARTSHRTKAVKEVKIPATHFCTTINFDLDRLYDVVKASRDTRAYRTAMHMRSYFKRMYIERYLRLRGDRRG